MKRLDGQQRADAGIFDNRRLMKLATKTKNRVIKNAAKSLVMKKGVIDAPFKGKDII